MKKIAFVLAVVMLFGCCFVMSGCGDDSKGSKSQNDDIQDAVRYQIMADVARKSLSGSSISFISCTYATIKNLGNNQFKVSGKVTVRDQYGSMHVADYDAEVDYDADYDDYDAEIDYGTFRKQ